MSAKPSFLKFRILAGVVGGLVCGGVFYAANALLDTSFSKEMIIITSVVIAIIFGIIVKPKTDA